MIIKNWDLGYLCESKEKWQELGTKLSKRIEELKNHFSKMETANDIKDFIEIKIEMEQLIEQIYCYPKRLLDLNSQDEEAKTMFHKALSYYEETEKANVLFKKIILENSELVNEFLSKFPYFKRYIELIYQMGDHQVQNEEAYVALQKQLEVLQDIYRSLVRGDMVFRASETGEIVTEAMLSKLSHSKNVEERKRAFEITMDAYKNISNTLATIYENKILTEEKIARQKGFTSHLEARLYEDTLPDSIISSFITAVRNHLEIEHQFIQYKKDTLRLQEFHLYDMSETVFSNDVKKFSLEEAIEILKQSFGILGEEYIKRLEEGFFNGWIDLEPSKTKRKDSFSCITYSGVPYTMLQYHGDMNSLRVLAHETGHMVHTSFAKENKFEYFEYSLFLAEIASKVHEILLYHYLIEKSESKEETCYLVEQMLSNFCTSLFSQSMLTEFELEVRKKLQNQESIQAKMLQSLYLSLANTYYGEAFTSDEYVGMNFAKIPHFYLYPSYYVWQYGVGISIAHKIAADLIGDKNNMRKNYLEFLKAGNRFNVIDSLKLVGIDLENGNYIEEACDFMKEKMKVLK
ncbi:MAG: oligoendopeptidase F family protein [Bacilli bacterium]|nr:oligoendopeptidase F family protein [Bacilli bacterium]